jgi:hypothetical protein
MFVTVLVRRLKPGKTYEDFLRAWYPDKGFGFPGQGPFLARNVDSPPRYWPTARRHHRVDNGARIFELTHSFDFSTDETVARGRP